MENYTKLISKDFEMLRAILPLSDACAQVCGIQEASEILVRRSIQPHDDQCLSRLS